MARIAATHAIFSPTMDEPVHIAAGYQYLHEHRYTVDKAHPPLARAIFALPLREKPNGLTMDETVAARRGNLLFVVLAIIGVAWWATETIGATGGVIAAALFALLPPILAHGGLATTDVAGTAAFAMAMAAFHRWLDSPTWPRTALLAIVVGLGLVAKFSFPLFFGIGAIVLMIAKRRLPLTRGMVAFFGSMVIVWAVYRFHDLPRFFTGMATVASWSRTGHGVYLLGKIAQTGFWYYFPTVLALKTPLPFLILAAAGIVLAFRMRQHREIAVIAALILLSTMPSHLNMGVRHILVIYIPLSILAAFAMMKLRWPSLILCAWLVVNSALAHPDYLPWMNALAGPHPETVVLDSNFDWGQDLLRLRDECARRNIREFGSMLYTETDSARLGLPPTHAVDRYRLDAGWCAVSESNLIPIQTNDPHAFAWLTESRPFIRVGKTIRLYAPLRRAPASRTSPGPRP